MKNHFIYFSLRFNEFTTKDQKQATRYVCQFSLKKKGGFDCKASYRTKKFKHYEKSSAEHDDKPRGSEDKRT